MSNHERKQWWAPVWTGLVVDKGAKHYRKMKNSVWLFLYLVLHANRRTGVLMRKVRTISKDMGITRDTTLRWLKVLRTEGYIVTLNTGRYLTIQVKNWKPLAKPGKMQPQKREAPDSSGWKYPTPFASPIPPVPVHFAPKPRILASARATQRCDPMPLQGPRPEPGPGYHLQRFCSGIGTKAINLRGRNAATVLQDAIFNPLTRTSWIPFHAEPRQYLYANEAVSRFGHGR